MKRSLENVLDECLSLLGEGEATLDECLDRYPGFARDLRPLLETALDVRSLPHPTSSSAAFAAGKRRMLEALAEKKGRRAASSRPFARRVERITAWLRDAIRGRARPVAWKRTPAVPLALASALALFVVAIGSFLLLQRPEDGVARSATLAQVGGAVELMVADSDVWRPASTGDTVETGSRVRTGPGSAATLVFFDGSTTDLEGETEVTLVQMSSESENGSDRWIALYQALGETYSRVRGPGDNASRFEIETPATVAVAHGTEFATTVDATGTTRVAVVDGLVMVTAQKTSVAVPAGRMTTVQPGQPPSAPTGVPEPTPSPTATATPTPTPTAIPSPADTPLPATLVPASQSPGEAQTPLPAQPVQTPPSPEQAPTPQASEPTKTHQPPGLTKTPQPPGQTKTPQPPGQDKKPKPTKKKD